VCVCVRVRESINVSMLILHVTSSRFCICFLILYHFTYTFSGTHTQAHTHKHTCMISTQEEWRQPGTGAWLGGAEERLLIETKPSTRKKSENPLSRIQKIYFEHVKLAAKLLDYLLRSDKSNINQSRERMCVSVHTCECICARG